MANKRTTDHLISSRSTKLAMSAIKEMSILSAKVPGAASLAWGLPSFETPEHVRNAIRTALVEDAALGMYALPVRACRNCAKPWWKNMNALTEFALTRNGT